MFIGLIEFAKPFRALSKQQLVDLFVEGRKFVRSKRLPKPTDEGQMLHDAHHAFAETLTYKPFNRYRFIPATPQVIKKAFKKAKERDPEGFAESKLESQGNQDMFNYYFLERYKKGKIRRKNFDTENFISGLEGVKASRTPLSGLGEDRDYWLGRRARKTLLPKEYKQASYMVVDHNTGKPRLPFTGLVESAAKEAEKVALSVSPPSSRFYYRKRFGKVEKVTKGDR